MVSPGSCNFAVSSRGCGKIDNDRAGAHLFHCRGGQQQRRAPSRNLRRGDDHVGGLGRLGNGLTAQFQRLRTQLLGIAALVFGLQTTQIDFDKLGAQGFDLLTGSGANVIGFYHCPKAPCGGDGLQSGNARAQHQNLGRGNGSRCRHQQRKEFGQVIGGHNYGLVSGHRSH